MGATVAEAPAAVLELRKHLDAPLRVGLADGRVVVGTFVCLDKQRNLLLVDALEWRWFGAAGGGAAERAQRHLGVVLVPRKWVESCHALEVA
ncbi:hypothetical protein AB1Y20_001667 [Prymnesium parvum]|uniref:Sm domain-containing protein n=1 Tax=Prymnesium parvum TaxID=97485 RepID=A0AB34KDY3_PRYPA